MIDITLGEAGIDNGLFERNTATLKKISGEFLELRTSELLVKMQRTVGGCSDERQIDLRLLHL